jgi:hypothetical protein
MRYECAACGITAGDLPDEVEAEFIFEVADDCETYCMGCVPW